MSRPIWFLDTLKSLFAGRYWMAKATRIPPIGKLVEYFLFDKDDIVYLPKNQVISLHKEIELPDDMVLPSRVVEHFVEQSSHRWLMNRCMCRDAAGCKDYPIELGCLFLGEATLNINPKLGRFVSKEEAIDHLRRCREAGLVHMIGRNKLDTFWMGVQPGHNLMTICNCCPCCCLFGVLPHLNADIGRKVTKMPGVSVSVNENCDGCGLCVDAGCFVDAIRMENGRAHINDDCRGCGHCAEVCPQGAIELRVDDPRFVENTIQRLSQAVDVS